MLLLELLDNFTTLKVLVQSYQSLFFISQWVIYD